VVETGHAQWKIAKIGETQGRATKICQWCRKSMSLNPSLVTDLRPEVELMHVLCTRRHYCHRIAENGDMRWNWKCRNFIENRWKFSFKCVCVNVTKVGQGHPKLLLMQHLHWTYQVAKMWSLYLTSRRCSCSRNKTGVLNSNITSDFKPEV